MQIIFLANIINISHVYILFNKSNNLRENREELYYVRVCVRECLIKIIFILVNG